MQLWAHQERGITETLSAIEAGQTRILLTTFFIPWNSRQTCPKPQLTPCR